ncbi:hypothetical protein PV10_08677 [Exophiala mesophila]|uniref:RRM domain-containing protein n=1 Tax=Exophiala mesophila TaxID=212818 RepID=A0A0D1XLL4_EXOME|nr:uncharacterized protein PV10_08677 [Exophiala mesophila]KIV89066.1 hypothetical protein PV10_08677 [Exophiala mesophila]
MAGKKRKESSDVVDVPSKKSKKHKVAEDGQTPKPQASETVPVPESAPTAATTSKKSRKRAVDFMNDEDSQPADTNPPASKSKSKSKSKTTIPEPTDTEPPEDAEPATKKSKKSKKKSHSKDELLSADGVNGVLEHPGHEDLETATSHNPITTSLQAEAERTVDHELAEEFGGVSDDEHGSVEADDNAAALLAGFDSDSEDNQADEQFDATDLKLTKKKKKQVKKELAAIKEASAKDGPGVVYVGRIPHGFYESQMREYFAQFGDITKLRLSRNRRTGASKHFAFIEFSSREVAKIVAATMDNYMLFGHLLKCKYAEPDSLHPDVWKGANKKYRKVPHDKLEREKLAAPKSEVEWQKKIDKEQKRRDKKAAKLAKLGLEMPHSTLASPSDALKQQQLLDQEMADGAEVIRDAEPAGLLEPPNGLPKDEVVIKKSAEDETVKDSKKSKKSKSKKNKSDSEPAPPVAKPVEEVAVAEPAPEEVSTAEAAEEFISLAADDDEDDDDEDDDAAAATNGPKGKSKKPYVKKAKKEKKVKKLAGKVKGPKSAILPKEKPTETKTTGRFPGVPLLGKDKYDKAKRQAYKEAKAQVQTPATGRKSSRRTSGSK